MDGPTFVLLSGTVTVGVPLMLAVRELFELRRRGGDLNDGDPPPHSPPPPPPPVLGNKPLPECLIPRLTPSPVRLRELEEA